MTLTLSEINIDLVLYLYNKFAFDLEKVRQSQRRFLSQKGCSWLTFQLEKLRSFEKYNTYRALESCVRKLDVALLNKTLRPEFDDLEAELTYLLIREFKPTTVVEICPGGGWSTSWILNAIMGNGLGRLYSFDLLDYSEETVPADLSNGAWIFTEGDVTKKTDALPKTIDYLFLDGAHTAEFAEWYISEVFPRLNLGSPVSIHDIFHEIDYGFTESNLVLSWLRANKIVYFTASPSKGEDAYNRIMSVKKKHNIDKPLRYCQTNPSIFFIYK